MDRDSTPQFKPARDLNTGSTFWWGLCCEAVLDGEQGFGSANYRCRTRKREKRDACSSKFEREALLRRRPKFHQACIVIFTANIFDSQEKRDASTEYHAPSSQPQGSVRILPCKSEKCDPDHKHLIPDWRRSSRCTTKVSNVAEDVLHGCSRQWLLTNRIGHARQAMSLQAAGWTDADTSIAQALVVRHR